MRLQLKMHGETDLNALENVCMTMRFGNSSSRDTADDSTASSQKSMYASSTACIGFEIDGESNNDMILRQNNNNTLGVPP